MSTSRPSRRSHPAQALVEAAVVIPILLLVVFGALSMGRLIQARMGLSAATREAARTTALSQMPRFDGSDAAQRKHQAQNEGAEHGEAVAREYGLNGAVVVVEADRFEPGGWVEANGTYDVRLSNLPWIGPLLHGDFEMRARHLERIDRYRSWSGP
jgi:hypothetical protein